MNSLSLTRSLLSRQGATRRALSSKWDKGPVKPAVFSPDELDVVFNEELKQKEDPAWAEQVQALAEDRLKAYFGSKGLKVEDAKIKAFVAQQSTRSRLADSKKVEEEIKAIVRSPEEIHYFEDIALGHPGAELFLRLNLGDQFDEGWLEGARARSAEKDAREMEEQLKTKKEKQCKWVSECICFYHGCVSLLLMCTWDYFD